jgi:hypothetical protein
MNQILAGNVIDNVLRAMVRSKDAEDRAYAWRILNQEYFSICSRHSWAMLRDKTKLSFSAMTVDTSEPSGFSGLWLPSNLLGIDSVRDYSNDTEYIPVDAAEVDPNDSGYRYARRVSGLAELYKAGSGCSIDNGSKTLTCAAMAAASGDTAMGEFACIDGEPGLYKVTARVGNDYTIAEAYNGNTATDGSISVRPRFTEKIWIYDPYAAAINDADVTIHYWKLPTPLYNNDDEVLLPAQDVLELSVVSKMPEAKRNRPVRAADVETALQEAIRMNPRHVSANAPRDKMNSMFRMSRPAIWKGRNG